MAGSGSGVELSTVLFPFCRHHLGLVLLSGAFGLEEAVSPQGLDFGSLSRSLKRKESPIATAPAE